MKKGFTLLELVFVISIISILSIFAFKNSFFERDMAEALLTKIREVESNAFHMRSYKENEKFCISFKERKYQIYYFICDKNGRNCTKQVLSEKDIGRKIFNEPSKVCYNYKGVPYKKYDDIVPAKEAINIFLSKNIIKIEPYTGYVHIVNN